MERFDIVIIGGGIIGLATAWALMNGAAGRRARALAVLEAEDQLAAHQTGRNSGVIHSGLYYKPGSLKAALCAEGRDAMYRFCADHGIAHECCGKLVVAVDERELPALAELERRGLANGLQGLRRLHGRDEIRAVEPHAAGLAALHVPQTGIVDYTRVAAALADDVRQQGGEIRCRHRVVGLRRTDGGIAIETTRHPLHARLVVNCAGLHSDRIACMSGMAPGVRIVPFRGEYHILTPRGGNLVRNLIYPVPDARFPFLGVHLTRMIGPQRRVEAGPNAVLALAREGYSWRQISPRDLLAMAAFPGLWRLTARHWRMGMMEVGRSLSRRRFARALRRLVPDLELADLAPRQAALGRAGVRAQAVRPDGSLVDDFVIEQSPGFLHVLNAPSPAATASLAIGRRLASLAEKQAA